jgi:uncharacterized protein YkwD
MRTSRVFVALFLALGATVASTVVAVQPASAASALDNIRQVVSLTNANRRAHGCPNLVVDQRLMKAAQQHSADMAAHNYFAHNSQSGKNPGSRITAAGYRWTRWAENIAAGYPTGAKVVDGWMHSSGHRANILNCKLRNIGVGFVSSPKSKYPTYWTQDFGTH